MAKEPVWFKNISPEVMDIYLADKNSKMMSQGTGNVSAKTTTSSPRTGRIQIPVLELNDVQNQIPVRRSERLKSKLMSVHLVNNVPNSYFEAENSANWKNWKLAMENELDSLDKHKRRWCMCYPPGYEKLIGDDKVCKLKKSIYGLPQSGRNWYMKIKGELENFGLKQLASDNCVFIKSVNQSVLILCMYVDDLAIFCNNDKMYEDIVTNRTRPDISFVISYLSQFNHNPEKRHYNLAKRVLRYLMGSKDKKLFYENEFGILNASSDASWGNAENGKSFSGGVVLLGNSLILWKCRKQKSVSLSTCEAELFSISEICKDIIWTVNLLTELKCEQFINNAVTLNSDSQAAIQWIKGTRSSNKSRHMNLRFHFIKDLIEDTVIKLEYVQTEFLIADFLTKAMNVEKLEYSMQKIALLS
ncbi:retrovirus-related Pol polyprotein from transposon RE2 [Trichonephila clavipes]|nr:retrovirus-related Pol polyprotein from transposon RE2 [Trichonephila clavipes]